ncbi:Rrf2 family protein [Butyrivibrio sp. INlla18]|uniref:Rrf2 family transcriptional regulator n=1 Tax=Butyrivibrio sp. INlla18 TaxID=1520806 RepID=UPI00088E3136|nr:Rrf2 family transcriptional regulator [Butyrivibrio sp. INlla18]SDA58681.1 Rrf2 family protein [Butyrivibrio sp. INlla18]
MQISSRFTMAIHMLAAVATFQDTMTVSSTVLADSVNANPVEIRRIMLQLSAADMLDVKKGRGGIRMGKDPKDITFLDVFEAVEAVGNDELFHFHEDPNPACPVGANIHAMLDDKLYEIQKVMEDKMAQITLADILNTPGVSLPTATK